MHVQELIHSWWKSKVVKPFYKTVGVSQISHDTAIPFLGVDATEMLTACSPKGML